MVDTLPSAIADDLVERLVEGLDANPVTGQAIPVYYAPPEGAPSSLQCWVRYGPVEYEWMLGDVPHPTLQVVVAVPRGGQYRSEYRLVNDVAHVIVGVLRVPRPTEGNTVLLAGEAPITGVAITEPSEVSYAGSPLMAATMTVLIENKEHAFV